MTLILHCQKELNIQRKRYQRILRQLGLAQDWDCNKIVYKLNNRLDWDYRSNLSNWLECGNAPRSFEVVGDARYLNEYAY